MSRALLAGIGFLTFIFPLLVIVPFGVLLLLRTTIVPAINWFPWIKRGFTGVLHVRLGLIGRKLFPTGL